MSETKQAETRTWTVEHDADGDFVIFEHTEIVAITNSDTPKDEARALLMSKAPDMADLLRRAHVELGSEHGTETSPHCSCPLCSEIEALLSTLEKI